MGFIEDWLDKIREEIRENLKLGEIEDYLDESIEEGAELQAKVDAIQAKANEDLDELQAKVQKHLDKLVEWRDKLGSAI